MSWMGGRKWRIGSETARRVRGSGSVKKGRRDDDENTNLWIILVMNRAGISFLEGWQFHLQHLLRPLLDESFGTKVSPGTGFEAALFFFEPK